MVEPRKDRCPGCNCMRVLSATGICDDCASREVVEVFGFLVDLRKIGMLFYEEFSGEWRNYYSGA